MSHSFLMMVVSDHWPAHACARGVVNGGRAAAAFRSDGRCGHGSGDRPHETRGSELEQTSTGIDVHADSTWR